jgi:hypothetical protein
MDITRGNGESRGLGKIKPHAWTKFFVSGSRLIKDGMVHLG